MYQQTNRRRIFPARTPRRLHAALIRPSFVVDICKWLDIWMKIASNDGQIEWDDKERETEKGERKRKRERHQRRERERKKQLIFS